MFEQLLAALVSIAESLKSIAASLANAPAPPAAAASPDGKPGTTETKAADKPAAEKGKGKDKAADKAPPAAATAGTSPVDPTTLPEYQPLKEAIITLVNTGAPGKAEAINILASFNAKKAADVPQDKWPALLAKVNASLAIINGEDGEDFA